eukprot:2862859-Pleurochrysis_carterae.AAC.1
MTNHTVFWTLVFSLTSFSRSGQIEVKLPPEESQTSFHLIMHAACCATRPACRGCVSPNAAGPSTVRIVSILSVSHTIPFVPFVREEIW